MKMHTKKGTYIIKIHTIKKKGTYVIIKQSCNFVSYTVLTTCTHTHTHTHTHQISRTACYNFFLNVATISYAIKSNK